MSRYSGIFSYITYLFIQYSTLSGPYNVLALGIGAFGAIAGLLMIFLKDFRVYRKILLAVAVLSIATGLIGTVATIHETTEAISSEHKMYIRSTADKYYSLEYGYSKLLLWFFPFSIGLFSSVPSLVISRILKNIEKHHT